MPSPRDRLIVALDLPAVRDAEAMVERLGDSVSFYKVGYQLAFAVGAVLCFLGAVAAAVLLRPAREDEAPGELAEARG